MFKVKEIHMAVILPLTLQIYKKKFIKANYLAKKKNASKNKI